MNNRTRIVAVLVGSVVAMAAGAAQSEGAYFGAGGASLLDDLDRRPFDTGMDLHDRTSVGAFGALGYRWSDTFATEVEGGLRARAVAGAAESANGRGADESTATLMVNARVAPAVRGPLKPYAGVGAGLAVVRLDDHSLRQEDDGMAPAGQAMAGFSFDVSDRASLFAEYRFMKLLDDAGGDGRSTGDETHAGFVGLRMRLGDLPE